MEKPNHEKIEVQHKVQENSNVLIRINQLIPSKWRKRGIDIFGVLLLFVTFTQIGSGGALIFLTYYTSILFIVLIFFNLLEGYSRPKLSIVFFILLITILFANISVFSLQYVFVISLLFIFFTTLKTSEFLENISKYAFYAMNINIAIYFIEIILVGGWGLSFDATIFNYAGAGRDEIISTWGYSRFAAHQTEPGSFASNLGGLTVLSLLGARKPTIFHWLSVLTIASVLSITAFAILIATIISILVAGRFGLNKIIIFATVLIMGFYTLFSLLPMVEVNTIEFMVYRLQERGGTDGSIGVKQLLISDLLNRGSWANLIGNRHTSCFFCDYSKSLGFGFYMLYEGGLFGGLGIFLLFIVAGYRHGICGVAMVFTLMLMRVEFFFPQVIMIILAISETPRIVRRHFKLSIVEQVNPALLERSGK